MIVTVKQAGAAPLLVKLNVLKNRVPGETDSARAGFSTAAARLHHHARVRSACVRSVAVSTLGGIVWSAPPVQVGTLNETVLLPFGKVRFRSKSIFVPQGNELDVEIWNGVEFVPRRVNGHVRIIRAALCDRYTRSGGFQRRRDCRRVSAAVVLQHDIHINAVVAIDDALLPLIAKLLNSRFEVPTMVKFWVVVPPLVMVTVGLAGEADVQLRSASVAVAV